MNKEQAAHILDAYVRIRMCDGEKEAADALRAVIVDAMVQYKAEHSYPSITLNGRGVATPTDWDCLPKVTCSGLDPAFGYTTCGVE